jgi:transketolase
MINELLKLAKKYKNIVVLSVGMGEDSMCDEFRKFFPDRYFSFGLAEENVVSIAAGFALMGRLPIIIGRGGEIFSKAYSQLYNDVCSPNLNVKIVGISGEDIKLLGVLPNMKVLQGADLLAEMVLNYGPMYLKI